MARAPAPKVALVQNADGYDAVAARTKPGARGMWDLPSGQLVHLLEEWVECEYKKYRGFIKAKNLPRVETHAPGDLLEVRDSYAANTATCMRRKAEQDATKVNVLCYVPNGAAKVKLVERWVEFQWRGHVGFVKARHVQDAPPGAVAAALPGRRGGPDASSSATAPAKAADLGPPAPAQADEAAPPAAPTEADAEAEAAPAAAAVPAVDPAPVAPAPVEETRECDICCDSVKEDACMLCPGKAHFFCAGCLGRFLEEDFKTNYAEQKQGKGRARCPMKDSEAPFSDAALAAFLDQDIFDEYLQVRIKVAEQAIQEQMEKENRDKIEELKEKLAKAEGSAEEMELNKHRLHIIDDIFTLKCPRCKLAFLDYDGCSAVTCAGCQCGFCSYCLEDCGGDAHQHFYQNGSNCPKEGGPIHVQHAEWVGFQSRRKAKLLCDYLAGLPMPMRQKVRDLIAPDAKDLNVALP